MTQRPAPRWPVWLIAFRHRNFRLLWSGQLISFTGSMMQTAAILWQVAILAPPDRKGLALGMVGLVRILPVIIFSIAGGVVADVRDRRRVLLSTQSLQAIFAALLAAITISGHATLLYVYTIAAVTAAIGAFDGPARQSFFPILVPREHLPNAISLNTILFQVASVLGPSLGGILIASLGIGWVYALNAISFLTVISALLLMRGVPERKNGAWSDVSWKSALEGFRFVFKTPVIRGSMLLDFFATFFSSAMALLPIFAQDILKVGPREYGWLYAASSVGALLAGIFMVRWIERIHHRGRILFLAVFGYGIATVIFGISHTFAITFLCLALVGASDTVSTVLRNVIRQLQTPDALRGRMTSVNMLFFMGGPQLGELEAGLVAQAFTAPISVVSGGLMCIAATGWIAALTPDLRRYRR